MHARTAPPHDGSWRAEFADLTKAVAGAFLFGMPLLFTMEMWWIGEHLDRTRLAGFVVLGIALNSCLASYTGFRREGGIREALSEGVEAAAIGIVAAVVTLTVLGQLTRDGSPEAMLGMIAIQAVPLSLGASVANIVFAGSTGRALESGASSGHASELANDVLATLAGAIFLGFAIAPTEEIPMLAVHLQSAPSISIAVLFTMLVSYVIVFASGFDPKHRKGRAAGGYFQHPLSETVLAYFVALAASAFLLICFGQLEAGDPPLWSIAKIVVLAIPASIGGAAGRVVV